MVLTDRLMERMAPVISRLDEEIDAIEDQMIEQASHHPCSQLSTLRRQAISLRRHIALQREVISQLQLAPVTWLSPAQRAKIREVADYLIRYGEDLDEIAPTLCPSRRTLDTFERLPLFVQIL